MLASIEFTFDLNGDIVSTSSLDKSTSRYRIGADNPHYISPTEQVVSENHWVYE